MELKEIPGFNSRYGVTIDGQVWSYISKRFLKSTIRSSGYYRVGLYKSGTRKNYSVHRLVMAAWGDLDINDKQMVAHHINSDKADNRLENLQIMSDYEHRCHHNPMRAKGYGINTETHKVCTKCMILKLKSEFSVSRNCPDGLRDKCKSCRNEYSKNYYQKNKVTILKNEKEKRQHV